MREILTGWDHLFGPWLMEMVGGTWVPGRGSTIGILDNYKIIGCSYFSDCNGASVMLHAAGAGKDWLSRKFIWYTHYYPFIELGVKKIIAPVESWNEDCMRLMTGLGYDLEATLKDASPKGNLLLYTLSKENCRWLSLKDLYRGKAQGS